MGQIGILFGLELACNGGSWDGISWDGISWDGISLERDKGDLHLKRLPALASVAS